MRAPVRITSEPCGTRSTVMPGSTKSVEPSSSITAGPSIGSPGTSDERCATVRVDEALAANVHLALRALVRGPRRSTLERSSGARLPITVTLKLTSSITSRSIA